MRVPRSLLTWVVTFVSLSFWADGVAFASNSTSSTTIVQYKILLHGVLEGEDASLPDGDHNFRIRIFATDGALIDDEKLDAEVRGGAYDLLFGTGQATSILDAQHSVRISIDGRPEFQAHGQLSSYTLISDAGLGSTLDEREHRLYVPLSTEEITAQMAENLATARGYLLPIYYAPMERMIGMQNGLRGLMLEMSLAPPAANTPTDAYQLAKYGRIAVEYKNLALISGNMVGVAAQALHVAHHLLFYSAGLTSDINGDGMFLMTAGIAHYQTGNSRAEPFVDAPFMRFKFKSSEEDVFMYSELETTMHEREYLSGTVGLGFRLTESLQMIGGFHHTEFVMPTEQIVREVNGIQGIIAWGL